MSTSTTDPSVVSDKGAPRPHRTGIAVSIAVVVIAILASSLFVYAIEQTRIRDRDIAVDAAATELARVKSDAVVARAKVLAKVFQLKKRVHALEGELTRSIAAADLRSAFLESQLLNVEPTTLANGRYFAYISAASDGPPRILVDLAEFLTGSAAQRTAAERGDVVTNAYYVVNDDPSLTTLAVSADTTVLIAGPDTTAAVPVALPRWLVAIRSGDDLSDDSRIENGFWLTVENGEVSHVEEQWVP